MHAYGLTFPSTTLRLSDVGEPSVHEIFTTVPLGIPTGTVWQWRKFDSYDWAIVNEFFSGVPD